MAGRVNHSIKGRWPRAAGRHPVIAQTVSVPPGKSLKQFLGCFSGIEARLPVAMGDTD